MLTCCRVPCDLIVLIIMYTFYYVDFAVLQRVKQVESVALQNINPPTFGQVPPTVQKAGHTPTT
jgi:hypothetical protein